MTRKNTARLENRDRKGAFDSPVALAFVRTVMARRGVSLEQAKKIYLDYLDRADSRASAARPARA